MREPDFPCNETERLAALRALEILDTPPEERFDRITRIARHLFGVPITLVSLVDKERQWFKSRQGLDATETPRNISFCGHAILDQDIFQISNALEDPRFADNPLVTSPPDIRFYAGAPLSTLDGHRIGTLCLIDSQPRTLDPAEKQLLRDLADLVQAEFSRTQAQQAINALRTHEAHMRAVVDTAIDGIITISETGIIESFNRAGEEIFGYRPAEVIGKNIKILMPEPYHSEHDGYLRHFLRTREPRVIGIGREVVGRRKSGDIFPMDLAVSETVLEGRRFFTGIIRDISSRKQAERELAETSELQKAILNGASYAIIATDNAGIVRVFNPAAERMLGYRADEMIGKQNPACFHDAVELESRAAELSKEFGISVAPGFDAIVAHPALRGKEDEREWSYVRKDNSRIPVLVSVTLLRDQSGKSDGFLCIAYDLTEEKKNERIKKEFVSTVSHELRTPLTSIRGSLGLIAGGVAGKLPDQAAKLIEVAHRNSERLVRLINDILDIEKLESGKMQLDLKQQALLPIAKQAIDANRGYAREMGVTIELDEAASDIPVRIDADRFIQVLTNLLANAAKFSPAGDRVRVAINLTDDAVRISVSDNGPGIPPDFHHRIFEKFSQADSSDTRQKGGTGLGLAISKSLVESMGGEIGFESASTGTTFWVSLPIAVKPTSISCNQKPNLPAPRILVCEDDPQVAELIRTLLARSGYLCDIAVDAEQAKHMLQNSHYDALTLDIALSGQNGISLIREIRAENYAKDIPVIVVSGLTIEGKSELGGELAIADWLDKPLDKERLLAALRRCRKSGGRDNESGDGASRILHVEDDRDVQHFVEVLVGDLARIDHAHDLETAHQMLGENNYDLVILDLGLPDGSGWTLLPIIGKKRPEPRVVVFSAQELSERDAQQFAACLVKSSTDNAKLLSTLESQLQR